MTNTLLTPTEEVKQKLPPMKHIRCCKPAVPKGLCRAGGPARNPPERYNGSPNHCTVCWDLWTSGHSLDCPKDSGRWSR